MAYAKESTDFGTLIVYAAEFVSAYPGKSRWFGEVRVQSGREVTRHWFDFSGKAQAESFQSAFARNPEKAVRAFVTAARTPAPTDADDSGAREAQAEWEESAGNCTFN